MESHILLNIRNIMVFSLVLASSALLPGALQSASRAMLDRWNLLKERILSFRSREKGASFWEIDMTKFEP